MTRRRSSAGLSSQSGIRGGNIQRLDFFRRPSSTNANAFSYADLADSPAEDAGGRSCALDALEGPGRRSNSIWMSSGVKTHVRPSLRPTPCLIARQRTVSPEQGRIPSKTSCGIVLSWGQSVMRVLSETKIPSTAMKGEAALSSLRPGGEGINLPCFPTQFASNIAEFVRVAREPKPN